MKLILQAIKAMLRKFESSIDSAKATADNAYMIANDAQTAANSAQTAANDAQATADSKMSATNPIASGSFSMGRKSNSEAGNYSHAAGYDTTASGYSSHAEGSTTVANGNSSHAEGYGTIANGPSSHSEGSSTIASCKSQHVQGEYNIEELATPSKRGKYAHIVGNGTSGKRSNAHTLDWSGNAWFAGDVYVGSTSGTNKDAGSKKLATEEYVDNKASDSGGIKPPTNAEVGQIVVVKAVDENGKPTELGAEDKPNKLPNPNALTFTGAVTGSYDGSAPLEVEIPSGEGGAGGGDNVFELIGEATSSGVSDAVGLTIPFDGSLYKTIIAYAYNLPAGNKKRIIIRSMKAWYDGSPLGWNTLVDTYFPSLTNMNNTWGFFGAAIDVGGKLFTFGAAEANTNGGHGHFRFWPQNGALPTLSLSDCKFISLDCNSNSEILPDGCSLIVWGVRK